MGAQNSTINICSGVRLNSRYEHSIYFASQAAQLEYFAGKVVKTFPAYSYLRKSWPLQVQATMEQAKTWSYLYFRNGTGKYYFYFISNVEYKNENMVELSLELDVIQTYMFDYEMLHCFVERQHTETDNEGEHTVDEGLDVGHLTAVGREDFNEFNDLCILILSTINPNFAETETPVQALSGVYNRVFSGLKVWAVDATNVEAVASWGNQLDKLATAGFLDGIIAMWMYPKNMVTLGGENTWSDDVLCKVVSGVSESLTLYPVTERRTNLDGYTPKNNKLFAYPFNFIYATNNCGSSAVIRYERLDSTPMPTFGARGGIGPDSSVFVWPKNYNGIINNYDEGLTLGGYPTCAWDSDIYKMWLAQNQNQHQLAGATAGLTIAGGVVAGIGSIATGNVLGAAGGLSAAVSGVQQIYSQIAQTKDMAIQPPQAKGNFSTSINLAMGRQTLTLYYKCVTAEQAKIIDDYFTMYGYKLNQVRKPNIHARKSFTYVKTVGCHIKGNLCNEDVVKIEAIFNNGITFWVTGDKIADYSQDNAVLEGKV